MPKIIQTMADFAGLDEGELVMVDDTTAIYLGKLWVKTCGCSCVPNVHQFPHIAYFNEISGNIEVQEIRAHGLPQPRKITSYSIIHTIAKEHESYAELATALRGSELMT